MKPLAESSSDSLKKLGIKSSDVPTLNPFPIIPLLARFMLCWSKDRRKVGLVWIDNTDSCRHESYDDGTNRQTFWHTYNAWDDYLKRWYLVSPRCPESLTVEEIARMEFEDPPGHALNRIREARAVASEKSKPKKKRTASDLYG